MCVCVIGVVSLEPPTGIKHYTPSLSVDKKKVGVGGLLIYDNAIKTQLILQTN